MSINKKATKAKKQPANSIEVHNQKTFIERLRDHYFSVPMQPTWVGLALLVAYLLINPKPETEFDFNIYFVIIGLAISITGFIAIRRKEFPGWLSMYTGATATLFGWLSLIMGVILAIQSIMKIIQNM